MKLLWGLMVAVVLLGGVSYGGEKAGTLDTWLKEMRKTLDKVAPKKAPEKNTTAVSGVRSADENTTDTVYWKEKKDHVSEEEFAAFTAALELAENGKNEESVRKFEDFLKQYPAGALSDDAKTALRKLQGS